jgi:hypothetical protein
LIVVAAALIWCYSASDIVTAEEQPYVGWWKASDPYPHLKSVSPIVTDAVEYRPDHTLRVLLRNTESGELSIKEIDSRWRVSDGLLVTTKPHPYPVQAILGGDFQLTHRSVWRITWDGPDRYTIDRVDLPPGVTWPTIGYTRVNAPEIP